MSKTHFGMCCVCGNRTNLTFEHIPPKKANNNTQVKYISDHINFLKSDKDFDGNSNEIKYYFGNQKGMGDYTLCSSCNNFFGANYVTDFINVSNGLFNFFANNYQEIIDKSENGSIDISIQLSNINLFRFQKQVVAMLMSTSKGIYKEYFKEYLLNTSSTNSPADKFKIIMNGYLDFKVHKITGQFIRGNILNPSTIIGSEIQSFPLGFTLIELTDSDKENTNISGLDITNWFKLNDEPQHMDITLKTYINFQKLPYYLVSSTPE